MGWAFEGVCYQDTAAVAEAFAKSVPAVTPEGINSLAVAPVVSEAGLVHWSITNFRFSDGVTGTRTGQTQLLSCTSEGMAQWPVQSLMFFAALFFAAFIGFRCGFRP